MKIVRCRANSGVLFVVPLLPCSSPLVLAVLYHSSKHRPCDISICSILCVVFLQIVEQVFPIRTLRYLFHCYSLHHELKLSLVLGDITMATARPTITQSTHNTPVLHLEGLTFGNSEVRATRERGLLTKYAILVGIQIGSTIA